MASIVLADDGIRFDGRTPEHSPLGGAESAFIALAGSLAARGHKVSAHTNCDAPMTHEGVTWRPLKEGLPDVCDLYIANRADQLIDALPGAGRTVFWVHNPASYLLKWRYLWKLWRRRPPIVFIGDYHASTYPAWAPDGGRVVIPYGIPEVFRTAAPAQAPPGPRALFTSNPLRGLDWLLALWDAHIHPGAPEAELHVFSGPATYGAAGDAKGAAMNAVLDRARALAHKGVVLRAPVPKAELVEELHGARVLLYRGDLNETFCLAVGEAQALGVPAVVQPVGSLPERVIDGKTGVLAADETAFAAAAVRLLTDDAEWSRMHDGALLHGRAWGWDDAARAFEAFLEKGNTTA